MQADVAKEVEANRIAQELSPQQKADRGLWWPYRKEVATLKKNPVFMEINGGFWSPVPRRAGQLFLSSLLLHALCQHMWLGEVSLSLLWVDITFGDDTHMPVALMPAVVIISSTSSKSSIYLQNNEKISWIHEWWLQSPEQRFVKILPHVWGQQALLSCLFQQVWWDRQKQTERKKISSDISAAQFQVERYCPFQVLHQCALLPRVDITEASIKTN